MHACVFASDYVCLCVHEIYLLRHLGFPISGNHSISTSNSLLPGLANT